MKVLMFIIVNKFSESQRNVIYCDRSCYQKLLTFLYGTVLRHSLVSASSEPVVLKERTRLKETGDEVGASHSCLIFTLNNFIDKLK